MKDKIATINSLIQKINGSNFESLDDEITKYLYDNRLTMRDKSLKELIEGSYFSQASFSRYFKKHGVKNYQTLKMDLVEDQMYGKSMFHSISQRFENQNLSEIKNDVIQQMRECIDQIEKVDEKEILKLVKELSRHQNVFFIGSPFSMSVIISLQDAMTLAGVNAYAISDFGGQEKILDYAKEDDLVVVVSIKERWFNALSTVSTIQKLEKLKCHKMLWTLKKNHRKQEMFDDTYLLGESVNPYGYTQLMAFIPIITNLYLKLNECENNKL